MFKLAGMILLMMGCTGMGINRVQEEKRRIFELYQIKRMILRIQNEMVYGKRTVAEICLLLSEHSEAPFRGIFSEIYKKQQENKGCPLEKIWMEQMRIGMKDSPLKQEEKEILQNLMGTLGIQDGTMQAADVGQSLDYITDKIKQAEKEFENRTKIILSISVSMGLFLSILLL